MAKQRSLPVIELHGSYYHMGRKTGQHFQQRIKSTIAQLPELQRHKKWDAKDPARVNFLCDHNQRVFPEFIEYLKGISEGSDIKYREILILNFMHIPEPTNCSTGIFVTPDTICLCHNEDEHPVMGANSYFVKFSINDKLCILSHCYPGCLPGMSFGFNSYGIFMSTNALSDPYQQLGVSRVFCGFQALHQSSIDTAASVAHAYTPRLGAANYNFLSHNEQRVVNVETTSITARVTEICKKFFHANHFIHKDFSIHLTKDSHSITRQAQGEDKIRTIEPTPENLLLIMRAKGVYLSLVDTENTSQTNGTVLVESQQDMIMKYFPRDEPSTTSQHFSLRTLR
jgi:predicted choloylglycine hydrolase